MKKAEIKALLEQRDEQLAELQRLENERQAILYDLPAAKLERNRQATLEVQQNFMELRKKLNAIECRVRELPEYKALGEQLRRCQDSILHLTRDMPAGVLLERYVRPDAVKYFAREAEEAETQLAKLLKGWPANSYTSPGPRLIDEKNRLESIIAQSVKHKKFCEAGEKIFALREEIKRLEAERRELELKSFEGTV